MIKSSPKMCPLCGSKNITPYWDRCWKRDDIKVYSCENCTVIFLHPMMGVPEADKYYLDYVSHLTARGVALDETPEQTFIRRDKVGAYRIKIAETIVKPGCNALEIGGGCGNFIGGMLKKGCISSGALVEACREHLRYAGNKFNLKCHASLKNLDGEKFDAVFMLHVLEHIRNPGQFLRLCSRFLKKNGLFVVEVPCSADPLLSLYDCGPFKDFYFQPMHHYTYSEDSLGYIFGKAGFKSSKFIYHQRYSLLNHLNWITAGKPAGKQDFLGIFDAAIENEYKNNLTKNKLTDTVFGVFVKK